MSSRLPKTTAGRLSCSEPATSCSAGRTARCAGDRLTRPARPVCALSIHKRLASALPRGLGDAGAVEPEPGQDRVGLGVLDIGRGDPHHDLPRSGETGRLGDAIAFADKVGARASVSETVLGGDDEPRVRDRLEQLRVGWADDAGVEDVGLDAVVGELGRRGNCRPSHLADADEDDLAGPLAKPARS